MRTDVKVGLFLGIAALLLAGWFFWPKTASQNPTAAITIGGRESLALDRPVVRPAATPTPAPVPAPVAVNTTPSVPPTPPSAVPVATSSDGVATPNAAPNNIASAAPNSGTDKPLQSTIAEVAPTASLSSPTAAAQATGGASVGREPIVHVVRAGDTLDKIAQKYYGDAALAGALRQANPQLGTSKHLRAGTKITVPDQANLPRLTPAPAGSSDASLAVHVDTVSQTLSAPATQPGAAALTAMEYKVKKGDTLYSIASRQLGSPKRWHELLDLNADKLGGRAESLRAGQVLRLTR